MSVLERYGKNPQFFVRCDQETEIVFSLTQTGGRLPQGGQRGTYHLYPFAETMHYACVAVFKLPPGGTYLKRFDKDALVYLSPIKRERENCGRATLQAGESYVIVASTEMAGQTGKLSMSVYLNKPMRDCKVRRVFNPEDKKEYEDRTLPFFIPEESEKCSSRAPTWKMLLCKESLPYMISDEDAGAVQSSD